METPGEPIVESYHVNLAKIENMYYNKEEMTREEKLLLLLGMNQLESIEEISKGDYVMEEVKKKLVDLTEDANFIGLYDKTGLRERLVLSAPFPTSFALNATGFV